MPRFFRQDAQTSLPCPACGHPLHIARTCHEVLLYCPHCKNELPLRDHIAHADKVMEDFLENVYCDRM